MAGGHGPQLHEPLGPPFRIVTFVFRQWGVIEGFKQRSDQVQIHVLYKLLSQ